MRPQTLLVRRIIFQPKLCMLIKFHVETGNLQKCYHYLGIRGQRSKFGFYIPLKTLGQTSTGSQSIRNVDNWIIFQKSTYFVRICCKPKSEYDLRLNLAVNITNIY